MKFLCPQCKAKYRIADEKLEQRSSSKMKCRKCGHIIDIKTAAVPESIRATPDDDEEVEATGSARPVPRVGPKPGGTTSLRAATPPPRRVASPPKRTAVAPPRRSGVVAVARAVAEKEPAEAEPEAQEAPPEPAPKNEFEEDAPTRIHDGGALTAAFSFAVGQSTATQAAAPAAAPDEWYVGIDGSPVGPLGLAQLKEKAFARKATLDSLVWRDGFEEWKPLHDFPELVAVVEEAVASAAYQPEARTVPAPSPLEADEGRAKVASELTGDVLAELGVKPRKQAVSHPVAWVAVFVAMAFGVTIGIVLFSKTEKQEIVKYVEVQPSAKPEVHADPQADNAQTLDESTVSGPGTRRAGTGQPKPEATAPKAQGKNLLGDLTGPGVGGPNAGSGNDNGPGNAPGGQLDATSITRTVGNYTPGVRRGCWETALSSRAGDAPASARVNVTITIAPSGNVDSVTSSGDPKGYPSLARCIESKVRTWRFPRSSGPTTAQVPFVFAAQ